MFILDFEIIINTIIIHTFQAERIMLDYICMYVYHAIFDF